MIITLQLVEARMNVDFTKLIETVLLKNNRRKSVTRRSATDTVNPKVDKPDKTPLENCLATYDEDHKMYYFEIE